MKLYAEYMKEREGIEVIYDDDAFISYKKLDEKSVFVYAMYSIKETRGQGHMVTFCKNFVKDMKEDGIKVIYGTTVTSTNGWEYSDRLLQTFGFKYSGKDENDNTINNYYLDL
jgi:hypothetical protein